MLTLGGYLKKKESLSARLGDVLSAMYLASMVLKHHDNQGRPAEDLPIVEWACRNLLYHAQEQLHGFLRNFPNRLLAGVMRAIVFPRGRAYSAPSDRLGRRVAELVTRSGDSRERLCQYVYWTLEPGNPLGLLEEALRLAETLEPIEKRIRVEGVKTGPRDGARPARPDRAGAGAGNHFRGRGHGAARLRPQGDEPRARRRLRAARARRTGTRRNPTPDTPESALRGRARHRRRCERGMSSGAPAEPVSIRAGRQRHGRAALRQLRHAAHRQVLQRSAGSATTSQPVHHFWHFMREAARGLHPRRLAAVADPARVALPARIPDTGVPGGPPGRAICRRCGCIWWSACFFVIAGLESRIATQAAILSYIGRVVSVVPAQKIVARARSVSATHGARRNAGCAPASRRGDLRRRSIAHTRAGSHAWARG